MCWLDCLLFIVKLSGNFLRSFTEQLSCWLAADTPPQLLEDTSMVLSHSPPSTTAADFPANSRSYTLSSSRLKFEMLHKVGHVARSCNPTTWKEA